MVAMIVAMLISQLRYRHISPMLWFSGIMVVIFGGLTLWLHDETFIKIKPTIYYCVVAACSLFGLATGRNLLKIVLGTAYPGLRERGWHAADPQLDRLLHRHGGRSTRWSGGSTSTDTWVAFKLWVFLPATFLFAAANVPMLLRHGLGDETPADAAARLAAGRMSDGHVISITGLSKTYATGVEALKPLDLDIAQGRDFRPARPQRRRQDDADLDRLRHRHAERGHGHRRRPRHRPRLSRGAAR